eukprot:TRINITY_DN17108_c0_g1_i1.p1 TRINITY_DN17108_c0_g1~~TRINITY_DN17108_c0_g1_i1.p1  ORF type:complete len:680 (-),score=89.42 TRINITY_DN17108_c0_g1_i1:139-2178(-)
MTEPSVSLQSSAITLTEDERARNLEEQADEMKALEFIYDADFTPGPAPEGCAHAFSVAVHVTISGALEVIARPPPAPLATGHIRASASHRSTSPVGKVAGSSAQENPTDPLPPSKAPGLPPSDYAETPTCDTVASVTVASSLPVPSLPSLASVTPPAEKSFSVPEPSSAPEPSALSTSPSAKKTNGHNTSPDTSPSYSSAIPASSPSSITPSSPPLTNSPSPPLPSLPPPPLAGVHQFSVSHLPPLHLHCNLPLSYPSHDPPRFQLTALWLSSADLSRLCRELDRLWEDQDRGQVVVHVWVNWLQDALQFLGFGSELLLGPSYGSSRERPCGGEDEGREGECDERGVSESRSLEEDVHRLLQWDRRCHAEAFERDIHRCDICFSSFLGSEFFTLPCRHFFCSGCLTQFAESMVAEGALPKLLCPDHACKQGLSYTVLKKVLSAESFARWEKLALQRSLDAMSDVSYCPRCSTPALEGEDGFAQCDGCCYTYCGYCRGAWHPGRKCVDNSTKRLILESRQQGRDPQKEANLLNELKDLDFIRREAIRCPGCRMAISKTEGCNKMTCANCGIYFCWKCRNRIRDYDHFRSDTCQLFEQEEIDRWNEGMNFEGARQVRIQRPEGRRRERRLCPSCGQDNYRVGNNNHIHCWSCRRHFCGYCMKAVRHCAEHYGPNKCRQHTT